MHTPMNNVKILTHVSLAYGNYKPRALNKTKFTIFLLVLYRINCYSAFY